MEAPMQHGQIFELKAAGSDGQPLWAIATASTDAARDGFSAAGTRPLTTRATRSSGR
jgi:hypothetical protein